MADRVEHGSDTVTAAVLAAVAGIAAAGGVLLAVAGWRGGGPDWRDSARRMLARLRALLGMEQVTGRALRLRQIQYAGAAGGGLVAWLVSGWPVAGLLAAAAVAGLPALLGMGAPARRGIERLEGLELWTRRLADLRVAGGGLEQALTASLRTCPPAVEPEVAALVARLRAGWHTGPALRAFAEDMNEPAADLVVAVLLLGARRRGAGLAAVLDDLAGKVAAEVAMRRHVEADRAKPRTTARWVTAITIGVIAFGAFNGDYIAPYGTPLGQLVLTALGLGFAACLWWMRTLTLARPEPRFLAAASPGEEVTP